MRDKESGRMAEPVVISLTRKETESRRMSPGRLKQAVEAIRRDGYVVIENAVPHEPLDILREKMDQDSRVLIDRELWGGAGQLKGHLQQGPPPFAPFVFREIVANPFVIQVNTALLGEGIFNSFYNGNTNCPGSDTQPLHRDGPHLWPGHEPAHPTACVVVNISPLDVTEENGAVELWPGTHLHTFPETVIDKETEEAQRKGLSPRKRVREKGKRAHPGRTALASRGSESFGSAAAYDRPGPMHLLVQESRTADVQHRL